jgi:hypothetical protein
MILTTTTVLMILALVLMGSMIWGSPYRAVR